MGREGESPRRVPTLGATPRSVAVTGLSSRGGAGHPPERPRGRLSLHPEQFPTRERPRRPVPSPRRLLWLLQETVAEQHRRRSLDPRAGANQT